jgi:hypothetical protein
MHPLALNSMERPLKLCYSTSALALILAACGTEPPVQTNVTGGADATDVICAKEYPIGSHILTTRCRERERSDSDRNAAADDRRAQAGSSTPAATQRN